MKAGAEVSVGVPGVDVLLPLVAFVAPVDHVLRAPVLARAMSGAPSLTVGPLKAGAALCVGVPGVEVLLPIVAFVAPVDHVLRAPDLLELWSGTPLTVGALKAGAALSVGVPDVDVPLPFVAFVAPVDHVLHFDFRSLIGRGVNGEKRLADFDQPIAGIDHIDRGQDAG